MDPERAEKILLAAEASVAAGSPDLAGSGFWSLVAAAKRDEKVRVDYARRIARIDRGAFERWAVLHVPLALGTTVMILGTVIALLVIAFGYGVEDPWNGLMLLAGTGGLLVTTHGLAHLLIGNVAGIRFTGWFIGSVTMPQPGVKIDYESYLAADPRGRARMHAAGAVATKLVPFLMIGAAWGMGAPGWAWIVLIAVGVVTIVTDVLWSVSASDWKKYKREMRYAREADA